MGFGVDVVIGGCGPLCAGRPGSHIPSAAHACACACMSMGGERVLLCVVVPLSWFVCVVFA